MSRDSKGMLPPFQQTAHPQLGSLARMPGEDGDLPSNSQSAMATMKRESVAFDPLAAKNEQQYDDNANRNSARISEGSSHQRVITPTIPYGPPPVVHVVEMMTNHFVSKCRTNTLDVKSVLPNIAGLQAFARAFAWKHATSLSLKLSQDETASGILPTVIRLRLEGYYKLKMFDELVQEATYLIQNEEDRLSTESCPSSECDASMLIMMRLLVIEVKSLTGQADECLGSLSLLQQKLLNPKSLLSTCSTLHSSSSSGDVQSSIKNNISSSSSCPIFVSHTHYWSWRISSAIVNTAVRQRQWRVAIKTMMSMLATVKKLCVPGEAGAVQDKEADKEVVRAAVVILCRLSRTWLQIGAVASSKAACDLAAQQLAQCQALQGDAVEQQVQLCRGLVCYGMDKFEEAFSIFSDIVVTERSKSNCSTYDINVDSLLLKGPPAGGASDLQEGTAAGLREGISVLEDNVLAAAVNNYAICAVYLRRIHDAVDQLEVLIREDPAKHLTDPVVFNLCTLYDLTCAPDLSTNRKKVLSNVAFIYHIDDPMLSWKSLRLPNDTTRPLDLFK